MVGWTSIDQAFFSLSNLVVMIAVARGVGTEALGRFSVAFAAYLVVLGCTRALLAEPLLAKAPGRDERPSEAAANTLALFCAGAGAVVLGLAGLMLGRAELVIMALALPITLLQDMLRYHAFRRQRPDLATLLDGCWLLGSVAAWPVVVAYGSPAVAVACWATGALLGVIVSWRALRPSITTIRPAIEWWHRDASSLAKPLLADNFIVVVSLQGFVFVIAALLSDEGVGTLRAGQVYFGPMFLAFTAITVLGLPYLARRPSLVTSRVAVRISLGLAALAIVVSLVIVAAEPLLRSLLYADRIEVPIGVLVPLACQFVLMGASGGLVLVAKARDRGNDLVRSRLSSTVFGIALLLVGTLTLGLPGAVWALAAQSLWFTADLAIRTLSRTGPARSRNAPRTVNGE